MKKLDEVIKRFNNNAEYERTHGNLQGCLEFRQLAEWLKDYKRLLDQEPVLEIKTVTNAEEAKAYPISENITKGFEEFTKMMFKQGQAESEE